MAPCNDNRTEQSGNENEVQKVKQQQVRAVAQDDVKQYWSVFPLRSSASVAAGSEVTFQDLSAVARVETKELYPCPLLLPFCLLGLNEQRKSMQRGKAV